MRTKDSGTVSVRLRFDEQTRLGPGKIALLEGVARCGSIAGAGRDMGMSYRRASLLIESVNTMFREPAVASTASDAEDGEAQLTELGRRLIDAYRAIERDAVESVRRHLGPLAAEFRTPPPLDGQAGASPASSDDDAGDTGR